MNKNFNIQLFAENLNTTATMSKEMKTFYEKRLIDQAEPRLVHDQFADYYPVPQNGGKTIEFRKYDSLPKASTPLTEGVTPNGQALNVTTITSDLHQYGGWTPLTDVLQMTAIDNNVVQATRVLASQAGRTMDSITRDVLAGGTNVIYAPKLAAGGTETAVASRKALDKTCTLTPKLFFQAAAQLGAMNADPIGDSYIAIIHPYAAYDLKTSKEFIEVHKYADPDTMFRGEIGKLGNIRFIETSEAKIWKDSTCPDGLAVFGTLVLGAHAYGVTELEGGVDGVKNYNIAVKKRGEDITFLRRIVRGPADDSYGIEVAKLAGLPGSVTRRAHEVLRALEATAPKNKVEQMDFDALQEYNSPAVPSEMMDKLEALDVETLTPIEALNFLYELKKTLKGSLNR